MKLLLLLLVFQACTAKDTVPVFLLDPDKILTHRHIKPDPLTKIDSNTFKDIVKDAVEYAECVILFIEENLSTEDVTVRDKQGSPFPNLQKELLKNNVRYLPSVDQPYRTLTLFFKPTPYNAFYLSPGSKMRLRERAKYIFVFFKDGQNETRAQSLRNHDYVMNEVFLMISHLRRGPVVGIYTGILNPIQVNKLQIEFQNPPTKKRRFLVSEGALFSFSGVYAASPARLSSFNQMPVVADETLSRRKLATTVAYSDFALQFNFNLGEAHWILDNVVLLDGDVEVGRRAMGVGAPWHWSYACGEPLSIVNSRNGGFVTISQYQIQPIYSRVKRRFKDFDENGEVVIDVNNDYLKMKRTNEDADSAKDAKNSSVESLDANEGSTEDFGKSVNCGPYFSTSILSGLLVAYLCLGVLAYGVVVMMNCGTNDRFDDPHGKEVIVQAVSE